MDPLRLFPRSRTWSAARDEVVRRWAITRLAGLGDPAVAAVFELLDTTEDQAIGLQLLLRHDNPPVRASD